MILIDSYFLIPLLFIVVISIFNLFLCSIVKASFFTNVIFEISWVLTNWLLIGASLLSMYSATLFFGEADETFYFQNDLFRTNFFLNCVQILVIFTTFIINVVSFKYASAIRVDNNECHFLITLVVSGVVLLIMANDLIISYLAIELQSLPFYILLSVSKKHPKAIDVGLKYFILSILASALFIFGVSLLYYSVAITNFNDLNVFFTISFLDQNNIIWHSISYFVICKCAIVLVLISLMFKLTAAPFHYWIIDIYDNAPLDIVLLFTTIPKYSIIILLSNICGSILHVSEISWFWQCILIVASFSSLIVGTLGAFNSYMLTTLLGYSSIAHISFVLIAIATNTIFSLFYAIVYFSMYTMTTIAFFIIWFNLVSGKQIPIFFKQISGLSQINFSMAVNLTIVVLALGAIPPFIGFIAKLFILIDLIAINMTILALSFFLLSLLSSVYYLRFIKSVWFDIAADKLTAGQLTTSISFTDAIILTTIIVVIVTGMFLLLFI